MACDERSIRAVGRCPAAASGGRRRGFRGYARGLPTRRGNGMELLDQVAPPLRLVEGLGGIDALEALDGYQPAILDVVQRLLPDPDVDVLAVTQAIAHVNDALTARLLVLAEQHLGPPPCDYAWLALGSHGRGEQVLSSDQDSALAYEAGTPDYFTALAGHVVDGLARAGLPRCSGGYMATSWSRTLGELRAMFADWVERPEPQRLLWAEVFLDVRPVHGDLVVDALDRTLVAGGERGPFRVQMARAAVTFRPPLTLFGRLKTVDGGVDVKRAGTAAIVLLARLHALAGGSSARTTALRLAAAGEAGTLSRQGAADLTEAYRFLTRLRLRTQARQLLAGLVPGNVVRLDDLAPAERERLRTTLRHVRDVQDATASRFATHTVT
jgi:CBS domain-containing protein